MEVTAGQGSQSSTAAAAAAAAAVAAASIDTLAMPARVSTQARQLTQSRQPEPLPKQGNCATSPTARRSASLTAMPATDLAAAAVAAAAGMPFRRGWRKEAFASRSLPWSALQPPSKAPSTAPTSTVPNTAPSTAPPSTAPSTAPISAPITAGAHHGAAPWAFGHRASAYPPQVASPASRLVGRSAPDQANTRPAPPPKADPIPLLRTHLPPTPGAPPARRRPSFATRELPWMVLGHPMAIAAAAAGGAVDEEDEDEVEDEEDAVDEMATMSPFRS